MGGYQFNWWDCRPLWKQKDQHGQTVQMPTNQDGQKIDKKPEGSNSQKEIENTKQGSEQHQKIKSKKMKHKKTKYPKRGQRAKTNKKTRTKKVKRWIRT